MLLTTIEHAGLNDLSERRLAAALAWLATTDLSSLECGRHEIMGDEVFANVMEIVTAPAESKAFEAHRRYHDIHCVIEGDEVIYVAPLKETVPLTEHDDATDDIRADGELIAEVRGELALNVCGHKSIWSIGIDLVEDASDDDGRAIEAKGGFEEDAIAFAIGIGLIGTGISNHRDNTN